MEPALPNIVAVEAPRTQGYSDVGSASQQCRQYGNIIVSGQGLTVIGDVYNNGMLFQVLPDHEEVTKFGLCFGAAPQIDPDYFVGRVKEIDEMARVLQPGTLCTTQNRLVLGGMGGVGKTQLAIAYVQRHSQDYDSSFWLNATSQLTLNTDLRLVAGLLFRASELEKLSDGQVLSRVHEWLSNARNTRWLLVFDNYDEPAQFDISMYCPYTAHGSILVTSRLPEHVPLGSAQMRIQPLNDMQESLEILEKRSRRPHIRNDPDVHHLAERLAGLPLALATAGTYLSKRASTTCRQYLDIYDQRWNVDPRRALYLQEYQDRTLYTTWDLSYSLLERDDADAAQMLRLLAYFDNQSISFELFRASSAEGSPPWLQRLGSVRMEFESIMSTLVEYSFIEIQIVTQSYSMHNCLHDWTLAVLNQTLDQELYWYAFDCVAGSIRHVDWRSFAYLRFSGLAAHATRIAHSRFMRDQILHDIAPDRLRDLRNVAALLATQDRLIAAEHMQTRALGAHEEELGREHPQTLSILAQLADVYRLLHSDQNTLTETEEMYLRVLAGYEKVLGADHIATLSTVISLGRLYVDQGKLDAAEQMYLRVLTRTEIVFGPDHSLALQTANNLGNLYRARSKLNEAEQMYRRAMIGREKVFGMDHILTLNSKRCLANVFRTQGKLNQAESIYDQLLVGYKTVIGFDHLSTMKLFTNIGLLYKDQGRFEEAEDMYRRALSISQRRLGPDHTETRRVKNNLTELGRQKRGLEEYTLNQVRDLARQPWG